MSRDVMQASCAQGSSYLNMTKSAAVKRVRGKPHKRCVMEESGPAMLDHPSTCLSLTPVMISSSRGNNENHTRKLAAVR